MAEGRCSRSAINNSGHIRNIILSRALVDGIKAHYFSILPSSGMKVSTDVAPELLGRIKLTQYRLPVNAVVAYEMVLQLFR